MPGIHSKPCQEGKWTKKRGVNWAEEKPGEIAQFVGFCDNVLCKRGVYIPRLCTGGCIVDNPCGQTCVQCGKLRVFNRYFALEFSPVRFLGDAYAGA